MAEPNLIWIFKMNRLWRITRIGGFSGRYNDIKQKGSGASEQDIFLVSEHTNLIVTLLFDKENGRKQKKIVRGPKARLMNLNLILKKMG